MNVLCKLLFYSPKITYMLVTLMGFIGTQAGASAETFKCANTLIPVQNPVIKRNGNEFTDNLGTKFVLGGIRFINLENYSATIRTQIITQSEKLVDEFFGLSELSLARIAKKPDRYKRFVVNLFANLGERWLQQELVSAGLAIVYPGRNSQECEAQLFAAERAARHKKKSIWNSIKLVIMAADDENWQSRVQNYQLVEGKIISVGETKSRIYLNFGHNWDDDFTVIVAKQYIKRFKKAYGDLKLLSDKMVRVRGWMIKNRGPMIEIYHPGQIEIDIE